MSECCISVEMPYLDTGEILLQAMSAKAFLNIIVGFYLEEVKQNRLQ